MHLLVYLVYLASWVFFATVLWYVYVEDNDHVEWILTLTAFEMGIVSQAAIIVSILYAIYWLFETGELIRRDRQKIADALDHDIDAQIANIREDMRRKSDLRRRGQGVEGDDDGFDEQERELYEFLNVDRVTLSSHLLILPPK